MTFYELAAAVFILATFIKFGVGALPIEYEMDATAELGVCVIIAFAIAVIQDLDSGTMLLAAAIAFITMTVWAGLQLWRMKTLFQITKGMR
jgi:hypothetical protein